MDIRTFSPEGYSNLLCSILATGYRFVSLDDFDCDSSEKQVILRHDVDYSPRRAVELAKLDRSLGIRSTFFFLVRGHWYNFLGHYTQEAVHEIHTMGFPIGLHYAPPSYIGDNYEGHRRQLLLDFSLMRAEFPHIYPAFSWHVPPPLALQRRGGDVPEGIVNLYSERFFHRVKYVSDSSLRNPYAYLEQVFLSNEHRKVQLVLHPECWIGSRDMFSLADLVAEILRGVIVDGQMDLQEKPDCKALFPSGIPSRVLDQMADLLVDAAQAAQNGHFAHREECTDANCE